MQKVLEDMFGPAVGLVGFAVMLVLFLPKVVAWYRRRRASQSDKSHRLLGRRAISVPGVPNTEDDHPDHGEPLIVMSPARQATVARAVVWLVLPLALMLRFGNGYPRLFGFCIAVSAIITALAASSLRHLSDKIVFYRTGMAGKISGQKFSIDYNSILSVTERNPLLPFFAPTYILELDDHTLFVIDPSRFAGDGKIAGTVLASMGERVKLSDAEEKLIHM